MINLKIPDAAYAAGWEVFRSGQSEGVVTDAVIDAAMPLAFAAGLRELMREMEKIRLEMRQEDDWARRSSGLGEGIRLLRNRIAELDPEGITA
jgi:hypothetical protein